jgi:uncharacterized membrane protein
MLRAGKDNIMENKDLGATSTGIQPNVAACLSYLLGWVTGLVFFIIEKDNKFVRFHAMQSIVVFGALTVFNIVLSMLLSILGIYFGLYFLFQLVWLAALVLWIILMIKAYQGEKFKLPVAGDIAEQNSK